MLLPARQDGRTCARGAGTRGARVPRRPRSPRPEVAEHRGGEQRAGRAATAPAGAAPSAAAVGPAGGAEAGARWARTAARLSRPEPASLSRSPTVMVADQRLPRVPAESGTILRFCALLLGAGETKRKCQEHVNQTRYSVTITSLSGLPGPQNPRRTPHAGPTPARGPRALPGEPPALVSLQPQSWRLGQAQE